MVLATGLPVASAPRLRRTLAQLAGGTPVLLAVGQVTWGWEAAAGWGRVFRHGPALGRGVTGTAA